MGTFCTAGLIMQNSALRPCESQLEVVSSNTGNGVRDDKEDLDELFGDEVKDNQDMGGSAEGPGGVEVTLSEGEEVNTW